MESLSCCVLDDDPVSDLDSTNVAAAARLMGSMGVASENLRSVGIGSGPVTRPRRGNRRASLITAGNNSEFATAALLGVEEGTDLEDKLVNLQDDMNLPFKSHFKPTEMRQLALVAHNHMKPAMKLFIESHAEILKKFRITGTNTTMTMCRTVFGDDPSVVYGATCSSGPLGGDAQLAALMVLEDVGGIIFFIDPLSAHPHQADIDSLVRLANVGNILLTTNPATAESMMYLLRCAMEKNKKEMFPSFFQTLQSPSVPEYLAEQKQALQKAIDS